jgi:NADH-quinone oxidoreductase subunit I
MGIGFLEGLKVTLKTAGRKPVTGQYPEPDKRLPVQERFMGFPALTWDYEVGEPYCTGCMVCIRNCPTQCMSATMMDNPKAAEGESRRRKIIQEFEINLGRCILCAICVDVCNFDAIEMSHEHELSKYERNGNRVDLPQLLEMGKQYQAQVNWKPAQPEKNSGIPVKREAPAEAAAEVQPKAEMSKEERLAAARARAATKRGTADAAPDSASEAVPKSEMTKEEQVAAARARAAAKRQAAQSNNHSAEGDDLLNKPKSNMTKEERVAAARARARVKRETNGDEGASKETSSDV